MPGLFFETLTYLERSYRSVLSDGLNDVELTNYFVVSVTDDEGRFDLAVRVLEIHILCEVRSVELLVVNYVAVIVLDDQGEFFTGGVVELNLENYVVVIGANVFNRNLCIIDRCLGAAAIGFACQGIAYDHYEGGCYYCDCFYYRFHCIRILYFTND